MSIDEEIKKIARELYEETEKLDGRIKELVPEEPIFGGIFSSSVISKGLAKQLLEKIDPDYFTL